MANMDSTSSRAPPGAHPPRKRESYGKARTAAGNVSCGRCDMSFRRSLIPPPATAVSDAAAHALLRTSRKSCCTGPATRLVEWEQHPRGAIVLPTTSRISPNFLIGISPSMSRGISVRLLHSANMRGCRTSYTNPCPRERIRRGYATPYATLPSFPLK